MTSFTVPSMFARWKHSQYDPATLDRIESGEADGIEDGMDLVDDEQLSEWRSVYESTRRSAQLKFAGKTLACVALIATMIALTVELAKRNRQTWKGGSSKAPHGNGLEDKDSASVHAPPNLSYLCADTIIESKEGFDECDDACRIASCCHDLDPSENCYDEYPALCEEFLPCKILHEGGEWPSSSLGKEGEKIMSGIDEACAEEIVAKSDQGRTICEDLCRKGACCTTLGFEGQCGDNLSCEEYHACAVLGTSLSQEEAHLVDGLNEACEQHVVLQSPNSRKICEDLCQEATCCSSIGFHGWCENVSCEDFKACSTVWIDNSSSEQQQHEEANGTDDLEGKLDEACFHVENEDYSDCEDLCAAAACCFLQGEQTGGGCSTQKWCERYQPCEVLYDEHPSDMDNDFIASTVDNGDENLSPKELVARDCDPINLENDSGLDACRYRCSERACCFAPRISDNCTPAKKQWCDEFAMCRPIMEALMAMEDSTVHVPGELIDCRPESLATDEGLDKCRETCSARACCFFPADDEYNCRSEKYDWCKEFDSCRPIMEALEEEDEP